MRGREAGHVASRGKNVGGLLGAGALGPEQQSRSSRVGAEPELRRPERYATER